VVTWWYYTRRGALLYETENKGSGGEGGEPAPAAS